MKRIYMGIVVLGAYGVYIGGQLCAGQTPEDGLFFSGVVGSLVYLFTGKVGPVVSLSGERTLKKL